MTELLPLATYNLNVEPYSPTPAIDVTRAVTIRITMAALNPEAYDDEKTPSTLRIIKRNPDFDDDDDILNGAYDDSESDEEDEENEEDEEEDKEDAENQETKTKADEDEDEDDEDDDEEDDDEFEEYILVTLSPKSQYQQSLDITIAPEEDVQFVVTGSYAISLTGNYIQHPFDTPMIDEDEDEEDEEEYDSDEYDLTPDEDEIIDDELDDLEEASDVENRIEVLIEKEEQKKKDKKSNNKRKQENEEEEEQAQKTESNKKSKIATKAEKNATKEAKKAKKVEFKKDLEEGPTKKTQEPKTKALEGGIIIEDRVVGKGLQAKKSSKVGMRYIGKLKNGKVFDKNTSGKPFVFKLGHGEVIKGWDIGVAGMSVGSERRIVIPAPYAYGKQALPGIPANSELTFDVKLVSLK